MNEQTRQRLQKCLGDWQGEYNPMERCEKCDGFHEEPVLLLQVIMGWSCYKAQAYQQICLRLGVDRARASDYYAARRKLERIAPHWRRGNYPEIESDAQLLRRLEKLCDGKPDLDLILFTESLTPKEREALGLGYVQNTDSDIGRPRRNGGQNPARRTLATDAPRRTRPGLRTRRKKGRRNGGPAS